VLFQRDDAPTRNTTGFADLDADGRPEEQWEDEQTSAFDGSAWPAGRCAGAGGILPGAE
jgi:hypothetical protein